jgi:hypothetical protein
LVTVMLYHGLFLFIFGMIKINKHLRSFVYSLDQVGSFEFAP